MARGSLSSDRRRIAKTISDAVVYANRAAGDAAAAARCGGSPFTGNPVPPMTTDPMPPAAPSSAAPAVNLSAQPIIRLTPGTLTLIFSAISTSSSKASLPPLIASIIRASFVESPTVPPSRTKRLPS